MSGTIAQSGSEAPPTEIVAPAGAPVVLRAALAAGADAVYLGLRHLSARAHARNFSLAELAEATARAHAQGARVYVTINTLVREDELEQAARLLVGAAQAGADGVIFQDPAVLELAVALAPGLRRHASTQMAVRNAEGVAMLAAAGAHRVVLARELSFAQIAAIRREVDCELEVFVHGALCYAASGLCLMSGLSGGASAGRSGNRGRCAQPCRKPYRGAEGASGHVFSPSDLWGLDHVAALREIGVDALKIEGRLRGPEYVTAVVRSYRRVLDGGPAAAPHALGEGPLAIRSQFSRRVSAGYLDGPTAASAARIDPDFQGHRGYPVATVEGSVEGRLLLRVSGRFQVGDRLLFERGAAAPYNHGVSEMEREGGGALAGPGDLVYLSVPTWDVPVGATAYLVTSPAVREACAAPPAPPLAPRAVPTRVHADESCVVLEAEGQSVSYPMPAQEDLVALRAVGVRRALSVQEEEFRLCLAPRSVEGAPERTKVPPKALHRVRRDFLRRLELAEDLAGVGPLRIPQPLSPTAPPVSGWTVRVDRLSHVTPELLAFADRVQLLLGAEDRWSDEAAERAGEASRVVEAALPPRLSEAARRRVPATLAGLGARGVRAMSLSEAGDRALLPSGWAALGDHTLYAANRRALAWWRERLALRRSTAPVEADLAVLESLAPEAGGLDLLVWSEPLLMFGALAPAFAAGQPVLAPEGSPRTLLDGFGRRFRVWRPRGEATRVAGERPLSWLGALPRLRALGYAAFRVDLTGRALSRAAIADILAHARAQLEPPGTWAGNLDARWL